MKLITRRILFGFCIILFLIFSPLIILYTFGFRYDFSQKKLVQTGIIYITPKPQDNIKILIDGKEDLDKLSIKGIFRKDYVLYNLIPKTYNIKIGKEGYHNWEKNLAVFPGLITYAQPLLLPSNPKKDLILGDTNVLAWSFSDNFKKVFYLKAENDKIIANSYDILTKNINSVQISVVKGGAGEKASGAGDILENYKLFPSPDGKKLAVIFHSDAGRIILLNADEKNLSISSDFAASETIIDARWSESGKHFLYLNPTGELYSHDAALNKPGKLFENVASFAVKNDDIYYLNQDNLILYKSSASNPSGKNQLALAPLAAAEENKKNEFDQANTRNKFKIIIANNYAIAIISPEKKLFIINQSGVPKLIDSDIESLKFSRTGDKIVYNSSYEIFTIAPNGDKADFVSRLSQKISHVDWYGDYEHIWYFANKTLKNIELDSRPVPNVIDFLNIPKQNTNIIYADSNTIYYDQQDKDYFSLYRVEIKL